MLLTPSSLAVSNVEDATVKESMLKSSSSMLALSHQNPCLQLQKVITGYDMEHQRKALYNH